MEEEYLNNESAKFLGDLIDDQPSRRFKNNAKAVECFDLEGNLIKVFRSGMLAAQELNIPQGEISLCCRGTKHSINGYRFRFFAETAIRSKRGSTDDNDERPEIVTRSTRSGRESFVPETPVCGMFSTSHIKPRKWNNVNVKLGNLIVKKWIPLVREPTAALQTAHHRPPTVTDKRHRMKTTKRLQQQRKTRASTSFSSPSPSLLSLTPIGSHSPSPPSYLPPSSFQYPLSHIPSSSPSHSPSLSTSQLYKPPN